MTWIENHCLDIGWAQRHVVKLELVLSDPSTSQYSSIPNPCPSKSKQTAIIPPLPPKKSPQNKNPLRHNCNSIATLFIHDAPNKPIYVLLKTIWEIGNKGIEIN